MIDLTSLKDGDWVVCRCVKLSDPWIGISGRNTAEVAQIIVKVISVKDKKLLIDQAVHNQVSPLKVDHYSAGNFIHYENNGDIIRIYKKCEKCLKNARY